MTSTHLRQRSWALVAGSVVALSVIAAGCGGGGGTQATAAASPTGQVVQVRLSEYRVEMPTSVPAGPVTFEVTNAGQEEHSFEVEGQGTEVELEDNLAPGETQLLSVDLPAGDYEFYCPVPGHKELGMLVEGSAQ